MITIVTTSGVKEFSLSKSTLWYDPFSTALELTLFCTPERLSWMTFEKLNMKQLSPRAQSRGTFLSRSALCYDPFSTALELTLFCFQTPVLNDSWKARTETRVTPSAVEGVLISRSALCYDPFSTALELTLFCFQTPVLNDSWKARTDIVLCSLISPSTTIHCKPLRLYIF